ncbi:LysR family transcriptional regulator [Nocardia terpenica]|uniref:LysR family transcriptional regulator n=1 Tax=Nocardia terpenica TaxID=455432 RepID=A0A6G9Z5F9_9NOCA|nr:LysR family transcriptional regulator [Nocardia terpenica]QIS20406.1 LysR family transcriptional regulator [Nocardia terpenica]
MLDIARLHLLRTVIATGSLRASATALGYTPSAASQQLAALQRQTGLRLVERVGRGIEPTVAGRALASETTVLFEELSRLDGVVGDLRAGRVGSLSIGYIASVGATWLPPVVDALRCEFPELRLDLRMTEYEDGRHDIEVVVEDPDGAPAAAVTVHRLVADPYVVVLRTDDPLAERSAVPLRDLADRPWIDNWHQDGPCHRIVIDACASAGFTPRFQMRTPDYRTALSLVATGIGITVIPRLAAVDLSDRVVSRPVIDPTPTRHLGLAVRDTLADHPAVRRTVDLFTTVALSDVPQYFSAM